MAGQDGDPVEAPGMPVRRRSWTCAVGEIAPALAAAQLHLAVTVHELSGGG
jgi:hypothetical protein